MLDWKAVVYALTLAVLIPSCIIVSGWVRWLWNIRRIGLKVDMLPGPKTGWLTGNLLQVPKDGELRLKWHSANCNEFKKAYRTWNGPFRPVAVLCHPSTIKRVMNSSAPKALSGKGSYALALDWLGYGLLLSSGPAWFRNRRMLTPAFHFDVLKPYMIIYNEAADILLEKFTTSSDNLTNPKGSVEIFSPISLCTLNVMLRCAFSYPDDIQRQKSNHPYVHTVGLLANLLVQRAFNPLLYIDTIYHMTANGKKWVEGCQYAHSVALGLMEKRRAELRGQNGSVGLSRRAMDFLDILLLARDEKGEGLTDVEIRQEIDTFLFEGHDTTASAIAWCLYNLACHPEFQSKAREEVDQLLEGRQSDYIEWDDLGQLPYLTMCIKESLRHTPTVPYISRELINPLEIEGVTLEPGTFLTLHIWGVHHNPLVWGKDHMEYKPERFSFENTKNMDSHAFIPFSAGPRNCIGQNFATNEMKTVIARVLHKCTFKVDQDNIPLRVPEMVMRAKNGINLIFNKR